MPTPRIRSLVSAAALAGTALLAACAGGPGAARHAPIPERAPLSSVSMEFDNYARQPVRVYLVGERREWMLGRVDAMGRASLRVPPMALAAAGERLQIVVLPGETVTQRAALDPRATSTMPEQAGVLLSRQWAYSILASSGQLASLPVGAARRPE